MNARRSTASEILRVIPKVMRILASEMRQEPGGVAPAHFRVMLMLEKCPMSLTELAEYQAVSLATMSNSISVLVERGWVVRETDPSDRRRLALKITGEGKQVLEQVSRRAEDRLNEKLIGLDPEQCQHLIHGLELLNSVFSDPLDAEHELRREAT
ncbi:MAG: MarR family transcriptional regulator [Anaerolineales bacterium]